MQSLLAVFNYTFYVADIETGEVIIDGFMRIGNLIADPSFIVDIILFVSTRMHPSRRPEWC